MKPAKKEPEKKKSGRVETIDVVYKCGHSGQRREIINEHIDVMHQLGWIKRNVMCGECGRLGDAQEVLPQARM